MANYHHYPENHPFQHRDTTNFWMVVVVICVAALIFGAYVAYYNASNSPYVSYDTATVTTAPITTDD